MSYRISHFSAKWERALLAMHGATETDGFIQATFRLLKATVECEFVVANLRNVDGIPMVVRHSGGRVYGAEYMERFSRLNPSLHHVLLRPGLKLLPTRGHLPEGEKLHALPFYRECMQPENWRHSVALFFWGLLPPIPQNVFCVFRPEDQPDFEDDDLARLRVVHPHISTALKRLRKQLKDRSTHDGMAEMLRHLPVATVLLDWDLNVSHQNPAAKKLCNQWNGRELETTLPPSDLLAVCQALKQNWKETIRQDSRAQVLKKQSLVHASDLNLHAEVSMVLQQGSLLAYPGFLIHLFDRTPAAKAMEPLMEKLRMLTAGEREAVMLVVDGLDNQEVAEGLSITIAAVKLRLHGAFKKLDVQSRSQLMARLR